MSGAVMDVVQSYVVLCSHNLSAMLCIHFVSNRHMFISIITVVSRHATM